MALVIGSLAFTTGNPALIGDRIAIAGMDALVDRVLDTAGEGASYNTRELP
jgi:hypothetical protein